MAIVNWVTTGGDPRKIGFSADGLTALVANQAGWVGFVRCRQPREQGTIADRRGSAEVVVAHRVV